LRQSIAEVDRDCGDAKSAHSWPAFFARVAELTMIIGNLRSRDAPAADSLA
jgi:hypothetical protein